MSSADLAHDKPDPVLLTLFANRFMSIVEAAGRSLQLTSISTNIKERLDFSCALFAPNGDLIANAPHLPVHLGSMSFAVRYQVETLGIGPDAPSGDGIVDGDVLMTNSPQAGGSHLPDITIISPVFDNNRVVYFVASRGHHSDVGGLTPGSMPPTSKTILEEGAQITSFKIVRAGKYDREGLVKRLVDEPASYPGCSGTRCLRDVESDLHAQIAANNRGAQLLHGLIAEYGLKTVQTYMHHIRDNAETAVRNLLRRVAAKSGTRLHAVDYMDDGTPIELTIKIDPESGSAVFDFEGTGPQSYSSINAPISVASSAVIYCLRILVDEEIPLNAGCLAPIDFKIPEGSIISPDETCAVVGGNVMTSQRVTDVVLRCFEAVAASQGCCNNLTFGDSTFGMYETIAGGSGAGPGWNGESGVHTHMTNTRITDVEILERRYPVILNEFSIRDGSGGKGKFSGGDGVTRDFEFTKELQVSILSERRVNQPYGLRGGEPGQRGRNLWIKQRREEDGDLKENAGTRLINLGGCNTCRMGPGDRIRIETPGAGGFGREGDADEPVGDKPKGMPSLVGLVGSLAERAAAQLGA